MNLLFLLAFCLFFCIQHGVESCRCIMPGNVTDEMLCKSTFATHVRIVNRDPLDTNVDQQTIESVNYTVKHIVVFKPWPKNSIKQLEGSLSNVLTQGSTAACGMPNLAIGTELLLVGSETSFHFDSKPLPANTISIYMCGINKEWESLTEAECQILIGFKEVGEKKKCLCVV